MLPKLIVGLGNPGPEYAESRHNVGFMVVDQVLARIRRAPEVAHRFDSQLYTTRFAGGQLYLLKPLTFMNNSGQAVARAARCLKLAAEQILVSYDCLDLPLGRIRLRREGSSGGHRGMESIIHALGTDCFPRLRVGIGRPDGETIDYVLGGWLPDEVETVRSVLDTAAEATLHAVRRGLDSTMNAYNAWTAQAQTPNCDIGNKENEN